MRCSHSGSTWQRCRRCDRVTDPFSELVVHHEVVNVFLGASQLELASENGDHERRAAGTLRHHIISYHIMFKFTQHFDIEHAIRL